MALMQQALAAQTRFAVEEPIKSLLSINILL
jgi:hypothetical protein